MWGWHITDYLLLQQLWLAFSPKFIFPRVTRLLPKFFHLKCWKAFNKSGSTLFRCFSNVVHFCSGSCAILHNSWSLKPLANAGIFLGMFLGIFMENGASWLEKRIFLRVSGISVWVSWLRVLANVRIFRGISVKKRKKDSISLPERRISPIDIPDSLRVLDNRGIFPGILLGISLEMVLAGLREGYPWNSQEYPSLKPASTISMDNPRNFPVDIPLLARAFRNISLSTQLAPFSSFFQGNKSIFLGNFYH